MPRATGTEVARARPAAPARGARARAGASYVFLGAGRTSFPSGRSWPAPRAGGPGDWLVDPEAGVQACAPGDLAWWLDEELWAAELGGRVHRVRHGFVGERGRLLGQVEAWSPATAWELVAAVAGRVRDRAVAGFAAAGRPAAAAAIAGVAELDALRAACERVGDPEESEASRLALCAAYAIEFAQDAGGARGAGAAAFVAAHALAGGDATAPGYEPAFARERLRQAAWLKARLSL